MVLKCIDDLTIGQLEEILPPRDLFYTEIWSNTVKNFLLFAYVDGENTIGCALYETFYAEDTTATCVFVTILEEYRGKGYAVKILRDSRKDLELRGYNHILISVLEEYGEAALRIVKRCGMVKIDEESNMGYSVEKLKKTGITAKLAENKAFKNIHKIGEVSERTLKKYEKKWQVQGYQMNLNDMNPELSRYFVVNDEILGFLPAETKDNEIFYSVEAYIEMTEKTAMALPLMMFSLVHDIIEIAGEDTGIIIALKEEKHVQAMKQYFGEPEENIHVSYWKWPIN